MGKIKRMDQVKAIIRVYLSTGSIKGTARRLGVSKNTVRTYVRLARSHCDDLDKIISLTDAAFLEVFYSSKNRTITSRESVFANKVAEWIKALSKVGVTRYLLWEEYREAHPDGYGYSQFCEQLRKVVRRKDLTLSLDHTPGEKIQIDFAGKQMHWVDPLSGELHDCEVLVAVLPYSQYSFAVAVPSQKTGDFIEAINQVFLYFGKLPRIVLSDNLKAFVVRSNRYQPQFNEGIRGQLAIHNSKPYQKKAGTRKSIFEQYEWPVMKDLPCDLFEIKQTTKAKVQRNYHVFLGEEKNFYSVPFKYVGQQTTVVYTSKIVEVYLGNQRIAIHERMPGGDTYLHRTNVAHMPKKHIEWKKSQGYDAAYFLEQAQKIGDATCWAFGHILTSRIHQSQSYNSC